MNNKDSFYIKSLDELFKKFNSDTAWLTNKEASKRLLENWRNALIETKRKSFLARFFDQMRDTMIIVLIIAAFVSAWVNIYEWHYSELFESALILLIVILNAIVWLTQESKAHEALESLKKLNKPESKVIRDWKTIIIKSEDLVVGDIVVLEAWDYVPSDIRLIETASLKIEEASLTWESNPVEKDALIILKDTTPLWDRKNMAYSSGIVTYGRGTWIVVATGMNTEVWKIAWMLQNSEDNITPLQKQLSRTAKYLSYLVLFIAVIIFVASMINLPSWETFTDNIVDSFMVAVAIAVAAIPEWLPAVVTIVLAMSVREMSKKKAIVRHLPSVETLWSCQVICSDKTWTLTLNKMTVKEVFTINAWIYNAEDKIWEDYDKNSLIKAFILPNDTKFSEAWELIGDPTETALVAYSQSIWLDTKKIIQDNKRIDEIPFDSDRKLMSVIVENKDWKISYTKWAFDILFEKCKYILEGDKIREITKEDREKINNASKKMASKALRVLACSFKKDNLDLHTLEEDMVFVGLVWMIDPPRKEVKEAVKTCNTAWIKVVMITWDHLDTARAIWEDIGIYKEWDLAITGAELDKLNEEEFLRDIEKYSIFARVSPENKVRIVKAFKSKNMVVAMTWDWVNDAPSLKTADIWIGMWITWTDVSKWASSIVLADDNFATIVKAVEEWRKAYANIWKAIQYLLSANIAEVLCLFIATIFLKTIFLTPVMILWVNLVTDSLPALALGTEKAEKDIMKNPPRRASKSLFAGRRWKDIIIQWVMQTFLVMTSFMLGIKILVDWSNDHFEAVTMAFLTLCFIQLFHAYNLRSSNYSLFSSNPFSNKYLNLSFVVGALLVMIVIMTPWIRDFFNAVPLSPLEYIIAISCSILIIPLVEIQKFIEWKILKLKY